MASTITAGTTSGTALNFAGDTSGILTVQGVTVGGAGGLGTGNSSIMKNRIINGAMNVWQRGTTFAIGTGLYSADRWKSTITGTSLNLTASQDTAVPSLDYKYSLKYQQLTSNATSVTEYATRQIL
jgi:hypothetical protein